MKNKWHLIASIIQVVLGIAVMLTMVLLGYATASLARLIITLLLAIAFVILGTVGIFQYCK